MTSRQTTFEIFSAKSRIVALIVAFFIILSATAYPTNGTDLALNLTESARTYKCYQNDDRIEFTYGGDYYEYGLIYRGALTRFARQIATEVKTELQPPEGEDVEVPGGDFVRYSKSSGAARPLPLELRVKEDKMLPREEDWLRWIDITDVCGCMEEFGNRFEGHWAPGAFISVYHEDYHVSLLIATGTIQRLEGAALNESIVFQV